MMFVLGIMLGSVLVAPVVACVLCETDPLGIL